MAEEALRKRDERFSEVQRIANIGQWEYDNVTGEGYWSEEYYRIHGFEPGEVTPIEASVMAQVHPDDREMLNKINWVTLPQGELRHIEFRIILKDGSVRHIHCAGRSGGLDKEGRHVGAIGFDQDITDYKEAQEKLKRAINEAEISTKRAALANQAKGRFLSHMSHELRTPLSAVIGYSDMMLRNFFGTLNKKQTASMEMIEESSKYLLNLINDILDLTKIDSGQTEIEMEVFSPEDLIDAMLSLLKTQFDKKRINVESSIDPAISEIWCDLRKCKQILLNLLSNAIKYTPENGLIVIRTELVGDSAIRISVQDSGVGIPADQIEDIFSEFYQVDRVRDEGMGGAGIGLALTRRLVELHAGKIGVESTPGQGSKFWFTLPLVKSADSSTEQVTTLEVETIEAFLTGRRILVVEDNKELITMILEMLEAYNHKVAVALNGQEALKIAPNHQPEIILVDMRMPVVYKKRMLFCIFSCTNSVRQFILSAWLLKLLIVGTVEVKISLNLARRPTINSATAAMIVVNKAAKTPQ